MSVSVSFYWSWFKAGSKHSNIFLTSNVNKHFCIDICVWLLLVCLPLLIYCCIWNNQTLCNLVLSTFFYLHVFALLRGRMCVCMYICMCMYTYTCEQFTCVYVSIYRKILFRTTRKILHKWDVFDRKYPILLNSFNFSVS